MAAPPQYQMIIRQQPEGALVTPRRSACKHVVHPPPVVELRRVYRTSLDMLLTPPMHVVMAVITRPDSEDDIDAGLWPRSWHASRPIVSSRYRVRDTENDGKVKTLFVFPEVNMMVVGAYRFKFTHVEMRGVNMLLSESIFSDVFTVQPLGSPSILRGPTALSRSLGRRGARIMVPQLACPHEQREEDSGDPSGQ